MRRGSARGLPGYDTRRAGEAGDGPVVVRGVCAHEVGVLRDGVRASPLGRGVQYRSIGVGRRKASSPRGKSTVMSPVTAPAPGRQLAATGRAGSCGRDQPLMRRFRSDRPPDRRPGQGQRERCVPMCPQPKRLAGSCLARALGSAEPLPPQPRSPGISMVQCCLADGIHKHSGEPAASSCPHDQHPRILACGRQGSSRRTPEAACVPLPAGRRALR